MPDVTNSYIMAKVIMNITRVYLSKSDIAKQEDKKEEAEDNLNKGEKLAKDALAMITFLYSDSAPLAAKYN
jgi:hypothetical protein